MKKIYLLGFACILGFAVNAQTTIKVKNPRAIKNSEAKIENPNSVQQLTGSVTCNTQYVAGSTMDLSLTINLTNTDAEYCDSLAITFPAGITPNSTPNYVFPTNDSAAGVVRDTVNTIVGQLISWGKNDNGQYGGISAGAPINFTVNVTITAGTTGTQVANYFASGDGYGAAPGDLPPGTFNILPAGATIVDIKTVFIQPYNLTSTATCNYGMDSLVSQIKNLGNTTESNISVTYSVNGVAQPAVVVAGPLAPGDSSFVIWQPAFDFSATNSYALKAWTAQASDAVTTNDTAIFSFRNHVSIPLTSTTYTNGIETAGDVADLSLSGTAAGFTGLSTGTKHSGLQALFTTVATSNPAGTYEVKISLPCMDIVNGETYRISYWRRTNTTTPVSNGMSGVFTGLAPGALNTQILPYSVNTIATWTKDSVDYAATATETRYFAVAAQGTVSAATQMNARFDDINITKVATVGISKVVTDNSIVLFPNPSTGIVNLTVASVNAQVEIFSVIGERVYSKSQLNKGVNTLDLSSLSEGTYVVRILSGAEVSTKKIVISK